MEVRNHWKNVTQRPFRILSDCGKIYQFLLEIYERDWKNGVPAPFFEYAYASFSYWMDISYSYKNHIWEYDGEIVAFCFYENPVTDIYFCLKPGYDDLAFEMMTYADKHMPVNGSNIQPILFGGQDALMCAARHLGYRQKSEHWDMQYDFANELDYPLPKGFHFVNRQDMDMEKVSKCCFKGFDHEQSEGPWNHSVPYPNTGIRVSPLPL